MELAKTTVGLLQDYVHISDNIYQIQYDNILS